MCYVRNRAIWGVYVQATVDMRLTVFFGCIDMSRI